MENVQGQVKKNQDVSSKFKFPMSLTFHEKEVMLENDVEMKEVMLKNDVEVKSVILNEDDVCDAMAPSVSSFYNSPDV